MVADVVADVVGAFVADPLAESSPFFSTAAFFTPWYSAAPFRIAAMSRFCPDMIVCGLCVSLSGKLLKSKFNVG